ncbi:MAG: bifunctional 5,10-methylenetetrahydrofolate dehydrogenase/5,10-methenyltetrahydrofolate cyclohydrolase [Candidatus Dojkabacteria bacterium]|nr:bifunctional 5,10-methylenetetrahydrofolate dehydrogenase/5,10-methenyltetrahydrofolate cyclohydrolase [Candidatus Dojkabacteria bacterium]MDQ7020907.1 bifunctional 5,10-methylenetetrahydrofolate dehydrogenase/5,10-methenyltetrahydrofolate cyclohydrolase [Candidatus Dojkabacteria bacterium]
MKISDKYKNKIIDGKKLSLEINIATKEFIARSTNKFKLAIILASNDKSSEVYVRLKKKKAIELGIEIEIVSFDNSISKTGLLNKIESLNSDKSINGILLQLPLYDHLEDNRSEIINSIKAEKDVDGLTAMQLGMSIHSNPNSFRPATVVAILEALKSVVEDFIKLKGKNIVILNNSNLIGKPLAMILSNYGAIVTIANENITDLNDITKKADVLVTATGKTNLMDYSMVKNGAILIDVTSVSTKNGVLGDIIPTEELLEKCSYYTPVPGGIGPMTIACLLRNVIKT